MKTKIFLTSSVVIFCLFILFILVIFPDSKHNKPVIKVLTYSSFAGVYGPGRELKKHFEARCFCKIQWFLTTDSTMLLQRFLILNDIDVVIGWDQVALLQQKPTQWLDISDLQKKLIKTQAAVSFILSPYFLPIAWSPIGFISTTDQKPISSLKDLANITGKFSFPEPRTSSLGLQWYYWIYTRFQAKDRQIFQFLKQIKNKVYGPLFSWSMSYGLFQKGKTTSSLSYLSSLLYHQAQTTKKSYVFSFFKKGQAYQIEYLSVFKNSKNKNLALKLAHFLLSQQGQDILQKKHYMFSVSKQFDSHKLLNHKQLKLISYKNLARFLKNKKKYFQLWKKAMYD